MSNSFVILREKTGLSVKDVAEKLGYSPRTVYRWENGESNPRKPVLDTLSHIAETGMVPYRSSDEKQFEFIDLFAGIGGLRTGFERAGGKCVFTCEWNKFCRQTYAANFDLDHSIAGDITEVDVEDIPSHDVLLAGFPCQPFSLAGVSKKNSLGLDHGFKDKTQGTLFFDIARILKHHRPAAFLLENVKNLVSHDKGRTFKVIEETLKELGYHIDSRVIDAKGYVPQHRERIFIAGFREDMDFDFSDMDVLSPNDGPKLNSILHPQDGTEQEEVPYTLGEQAVVNEKYTLSDKLWTYLQNYAEKHRKKGNGFGFGLVGPEDSSRTLSARYYKDGSEILIRQDGDRPRRLTPRECSRLMGFDRPGEAGFEIPVSDTQAYKQFGNAVAVPVVEAVAKFMKPFIVDGKKHKGQMFMFTGTSD
ncbi:MAG: DNA (cytosine-5-)-methyltransferase [Balneolaceae bacterium]